jgi:hypothetical protein
LREQNCSCSSKNGLASHLPGTAAEGQKPSFASAYWDLAPVFEKQNRRPDAIHELQLALRLDPGFEPAKKELKRLS